jgi:hypothetical protein
MHELLHSFTETSSRLSSTTDADLKLGTERTKAKISLAQQRSIPNDQTNVKHTEHRDDNVPQV